MHRSSEIERSVVLTNITSTRDISEGGFYDTDIPENLHCLEFRSEHSEGTTKLLNHFTAIQLNVRVICTTPTKYDSEAI